MRTILALALALLAAPEVTAKPARAAPQAQLAASDRAQIDAVVTRLEAAWNAHDPAAWAGQFHDDATWILWTGGEWAGRPAILAGITVPFRTFFATSSERSRIEGVRAIAPGVAMARLLTVLTGDPRQPGATFHFKRTLLLTRQGGRWAIRHGQNTRLSEAETARLK